MPGHFAVDFVADATAWLLGIGVKPGFALPLLMWCGFVRGLTWHAAC